MTPETLLEEILANPHCDEPRLRYADWLDERCLPLGEFIRTQIHLAKLPLGDARLLELERREQELLAEFESAWVAGLPERVEWWVFRRGFVNEVAVTVEQFLTHAGYLFQRFPIQEVHVRASASATASASVAALACAPELAQARYLDLSSNRLGDGGARALAASTHVRGVRGLNLSCTGLGDAGAQALAQSPHLGGLMELYLSNNRIGDIGGCALAASPRLGRLERLFLDCNAIEQTGAELLNRRFGGRVHLR
jgi:uncharacterized protein (TIGR02996 family)